MIYAKLTAATLLAGSVLVGGYAVAKEILQDTGPAATAASPAATSPVGSAPVAGVQAPAPMAIPQLIDVLAKQGYTDVSEVERKTGAIYEIKASDANGNRRELYVDSRTGDILKEEGRGKGEREHRR
ncbi:PepSY domain-containing protein [Rhodocista pekingensis]|uniref:PepSY domain-containing protein n=1 Tax=Rhodocista pekingensis TaxID=201185 RepID=A0ABW2KQN6_9PROT